MRFSIPTSKHRIAVNFPDDEYAELAGLADKHDVLLACLDGRKFSNSQAGIVTSSCCCHCAFMAVKICVQRRLSFMLFS
jgi:hypothetical protein